MKGGGIKSRCCGNSEVVRLGDVAARRGSRREGEGQMGRLFTHQRSAEGRARRRQGGGESFAGAFASGVLKLVAYRPAPERPTMGCRFGPKKRRPENSDRRCLLLFPGEGEARRRRNKDDVRLNMGQHLAQMLLHCVSSREATGAEKGAIHSAQTSASCASSKRARCESETNTSLAETGDSLSAGACVVSPGEGGATVPGRARRAPRRMCIGASDMTWQYSKR